MGIVLLLLVPGGMVARAGGPPEQSPAWVKRMFGPAAKPAPAKPKTPPVAVAKAPVDKAPAPARPTSKVDEAAVQRDRELQVLLRRQAVCLKLMRIAMDTNDDELMRKAEQLDERARGIYAQRTADLPGNQAAFESDEHVLERHLGPTSSAIGSLVDPAAPQTAVGQARAGEDDR